MKLTKIANGQYKISRMAWMELGKKAQLTQDVIYIDSVDGLWHVTAYTGGTHVRIDLGTFSNPQIQDVISSYKTMGYDVKVNTQNVTTDAANQTKMKKKAAFLNLEDIEIPEYSLVRCVECNKWNDFAHNKMTEWKSEDELNEDELTIVTAEKEKIENGKGSGWSTCQHCIEAMQKEAEYKTVVLKKLINSRGELIPEIGYAIEGVGIQGVDEQNYPAGISEDGSLFVEELNADNNVTWNGEVISGNWDINKNYKSLL